MTTLTKPATKAGNGPTQALRVLHLCTLCGFAVTQPLLVALVRQTVYLHDEEIEWLEIGVLLSVLMLILPIGILAVDQVMLQVSGRIGGRGRNTMFAVLFGIVLLSFLRPLLAVDWVETTGFGGLLALIVVVPSAWYLAQLYSRVSWVRSWLTIASLGLAVFPGMFLWQFTSIRQAEKSIEGRLSVKNPVPVVLVVFDEFSGTTLMNEQLEIDVQHFPQFARLGGRSTWYRNATTVHPRTHVAVPSILSGRFPKTELSPLASQYPGNLFQVIDSTKIYDMAVFEPVTRVCPASVRHYPKPKRPALQRCTDLLCTLGAIYPRLILSKDVPTWLPPIPRPWFGLSSKTRLGLEDYYDDTEGVFNYPGEEHRNQQFEHFLKCLFSADKPRFCFFHTLLPHYPWTFLPSGEQYLTEFSASRFPAGASGELGENWRDEPSIVLRNEYRYRLQLGHVDQRVGQILDRLEETGLMDRCLLIVTADHGVSFRPGHSRRLPDAENLSEILSVPLFVKFPGQTEGRIDDRNVESVDILPTIAEVLDIELPEPVDGIAVSKEQRPPRKSFYFESTMTPVEPDLPQRLSAVRRHFTSFGNGTLDQLPIAAASHPDWHGQPVSNFVIDERTIPVVQGSPHKTLPWKMDAPDTKLVNCLVNGWLEPNDLPETQADLVVAVDGTIVDSGKTFPSARGTQGFEFVLPKLAKTETLGQVDIYLVDTSQEQVRFTRLKNQPGKEDLYRDR